VRSLWGSIWDGDVSLVGLQILQEAMQGDVRPRCRHRTRQHPALVECGMCLAHDVVYWLLRFVSAMKGRTRHMRSRANCPSGRLETGSQNQRQPHPLGADASDEALIAGIVRGDRHAMAIFYRRHYVRVYRFALRIVGDAASAEDIVSDVFL